MIPTLRTVAKDRGALAIVVFIFLTFLFLGVGAWKHASVPFIIGFVVTSVVLRLRPTLKAPVPAADRQGTGTNND